MDVCSKFHGNPPCSCCDILLKATSLNLKVALEEVFEDPQSQEDSSPTKPECLNQIVPVVSGHYLPEVLMSELNSSQMASLPVVREQNAAVGYHQLSERVSIDSKHLGFCFNIMEVGL